MKLYKVFSIWEYLTVAFFIVAVLFLLLFYLNNNSLNEKGITALKNKDFRTAQKYFQKNVESGFLDNRSYLNLGLSYDLLNQPLKAFEIYKIVSSSNSRRIWAFFSYFNQAGLYGRLGNLERALESYQSALEFRQKEKEIKTNIELLFKNNKQGSKKGDSDSKNQSSGSDKGPSKEDKKEDLGESSDKDPSEEDKKEDLGESSDKDPSEEDKEDKQGGSSEEDPSEEDKKEDSGGSSEEDPSKEDKSDKKVLTEREQSAILEEVQQQENKVRARFYQNKKTFGDKTSEDW
ncbi:MAG: hypothetical protein OXJ52_07510 [Oligoflexia bacterium]|nr:hypothetical protein [Oligoflexia bacterium]